MSNITNAAIASINEQRQLEAREKAKRLILALAQSNTVIEARVASIEKLREELKKLANDKFNVLDIIGELPRSTAAVTISETIQALNEEEAKRLTGRCTELDSQIRSAQLALEVETNNRSALRKTLSEIKVETVNAEIIA